MDGDRTPAQVVSCGEGGLPEAETGGRGWGWAGSISTAREARAGLALTCLKVHSEAPVWEHVWSRRSKYRLDRPAVAAWRPRFCVRHVHGVSNPIH